MTEGYLEPGDLIVCRNGHEIAEVAETIYEKSENTWRLKQFKNWRSEQTPPKEFEPVGPCSVCGAPWFIIEWNGRIFLRTKEGLKMPDPERIKR